MGSINRCLVLLLLPLVLAGCEALSPAECATANWRQLGLQDGTRGNADRAADYYESCSKAGIAVDVVTYRAGRSEGLQSYCRLDNAMQEGLSGRGYDGVCPAPIDQNFRFFHDAGYRVWDSRNALSRLQREQDQLQAELRDSKTAEDRKRSLREQLSRMDRRMEDARRNIRSAEFNLDRLRDDLRRRGGS